MLMERLHSVERIAAKERKERKESEKRKERQERKERKESMAVGDCRVLMSLRFLRSVAVIAFAPMGHLGEGAARSKVAGPSRSRLS